MKGKKLFAVLLCAVLAVGSLSGCGESKSDASESETNSQVFSAASVDQADLPAGQIDVSQPQENSEVESTAETRETAYGTGTYLVEAVSGKSIDRLEYQDGQLVYHYFSDPEMGKGSYGRDGSDELEYSPYYQKILEEAVEQLEQEGKTVSIQEQK